jgi:DNA-binding transcriptional LysR family regulator
MQDLNWNDLRYVLVLSRSGRLARAARQLGVDETTIARRVARIEKVLGSRLFERVNGILLATEIGHVVVQHAERIEVDVGEVKNAATGADARVAGSARITTIPMLLNRMLLPALPALLKAHPQLQLQLVADPRNLSLMNREADIALRFTRPDKEHRIVARRVGEIAYAVYGPAGPQPTTLPWITYEGSLSALPHASWMVKAIKEERDAGTRLIVNDSDVAVHAIRAGLGRSLLPCCIGDREHELSRLSGQKPVLSRELWLLVHPELRHLARIRAVISWIEQVIVELDASKRRQGQQCSAI